MSTRASTITRREAKRRAQLKGPDQTELDLKWIRANVKGWSPEVERTLNEPRLARAAR